MLCSSKLIQQGLASLYAIAPGGIEIVGVPWIGYFARSRGVVEQTVDLAVRVAATHTLHVADVPVVHADEQVVVLVVATGELTGRLAVTADAMFGQFTTSRWIDGIADLLGAGGSRSDLELVRAAGLIDQPLHYELCHWTTADIAVANKEYAMHIEV